MPRFLSLLAAAVAAAFAQDTTGALTGTVADPSGAFVANAAVTASTVATGLSRTAAASLDGRYRIAALPPGRYEVAVQAPRFKMAVFRDVQVQVEQVVTLNSVLELGATQEPVTVDGGASLVQFESTTVGQVVENRRVVGLPLNGRRFLQLAMLAPGTTAGYTRDVNRQGGERAGSQFNIAVNGTRAEFNNLLLDGVLNTDENFGTFVVSPSIDAIEEFKVQTSNYSAQFGRGGGAQVNIITKSGTNEFRGAAFEFLRNAAFDAKNFFAQRNLPNPPFRQNQFGLTAGGPVRLPRLYDGKNRTFFLFHYEGQRIFQAQTAISTVPGPALRPGDFSGLPAIFDPAAARSNPARPGTVVRDPFPGNRIPSGRFDPTTQTLLAYNPLPNRPGADNNYLSDEGRRTTNNQYTARADHSFSQADALFVRYSISDESAFNPGALPGTGNLAAVRGQLAAIGHTHIFGPSTVNELRLGFNRLCNALLQQNAYVLDAVGNAGIVGLSRDPIDFGIPAISVQGFTGWGDQAFSFPSLMRNNVFQVTENLGLVRGRHNINSGAELRRFYFHNFANNPGRGSYAFRSPLFTSNPAQPGAAGIGFADYLLGLPAFVEGAVGDTAVNSVRPSWNFYFQDDWKAARRLTIALGLRYELNPYPVEERDRIQTIDFGAAVPTIVRAGQGGPYEGYPRKIVMDSSIPYVRDGRFGRSLLRTDGNDLSPRIGFAFTLTPLTALRGGYGIYYAQDLANAFFDLARNVPRNIRAGLTSDPNTPQLAMTTAFAGLASGQTILRPTLVMTDPGYRTSYIQQWSFNVQRQLAPDLVIEVGYAGTKGTKLGILNLFHLAPPAPGAPQPRRPFPQCERIFLIQHRVNSAYHSLQARVEKRFSRGFSALIAYTFAKSIDFASSTRTTGEGSRPIDPNNLSLERGRSLFDARQNLVANALWSLPLGKHWLWGGWQTGVIAQLRSGLPFTVSANGDLANTGNDASGRANLAPGQHPRLSTRSPERWFNTQAYSAPPPFTFGNAGRNTLDGPGLVHFDLTAIKVFRLHERLQAQLRGEFFNLTNTPAFRQPSRNVNGAAFGAISSANPARQIQFALKLLW